MASDCVLSKCPAELLVFNAELVSPQAPGKNVGEGPPRGSGVLYPKGVAKVLLCVYVKHKSKAPFLPRPGVTMDFSKSVTIDYECQKGGVGV